MSAEFTQSQNTPNCHKNWRTMHSENYPSRPLHYVTFPRVANTTAWIFSHLFLALSGWKSLRLHKLYQ